MYIFLYTYFIYHWVCREKKNEAQTHTIKNKKIIFANTCLRKRRTTDNHTNTQHKTSREIQDSRILSQKLVPRAYCCEIIFQSTTRAWPLNTVEVVTTTAPTSRLGTLR